VSPRRTPPSVRRQRALWLSLIIVVVVAVGSLAGTLAAKWSPRLGLDLAGGFSVVYQPVRHVTASDLSEIVDVMNNRVNGLGVSGATVSTQGNQQVVVDVPGVKNAQAELKQIGATAQLLFRPVLCYAPRYQGRSNPHAAVDPSALPQTCPSSYQLVTSNLQGSASSSGGVAYPSPAQGFQYPTLAKYPSTAPTTDETHPNSVVLLGGLPSSGCYPNRCLLGPAELTGRAVKSAVAQEQTSTGTWVVNFTLTGAGAVGWNSMAQKYFHEVIGIELDGVVQSAPITQPTQSSFSSFGNTVQVSGNFTQASADALANALNYGSLPVPLKTETSQTVSPTLGKADLRAGLAAGIAGLILVLLYTIVYYRLLGIVVVTGLAVTAALLYSIISALGHTSLAPSFNLSGVVGLIVSVGITVDSYIVYFERLKDETRAGRTVRTSVDRGFKSAYRTVLAADLVSFIGALCLYVLSVGDVKGFAFFLGLSTILDVVVTYFFTRPLVILLGRNERLTEARTIGISRGLALHSGVES